MSAGEIIRLVENEGCSLEAMNGRLKITQGERLDPSLVEWVKKNKAEIVAVLNRDKEAQGIGFLVGLYGSIYMQSLGKRSHVYLEDMSEWWELRRETYTETASYSKILAKGTFPDVLQRASSYFNYIKGVSA
ncbi:hypothetical protein [Halobacillus karajensis]|uniref:TubC N-terminal docking domain-containing protein n=1 Tax=Halobacillus karajensis TaxID=195088 RepID=A0A024P736_9BACI|nr:hypothetical protein [Halobacillus karajensis]CDQ20987.1 hypothetical protein BN982_03348 [Halobacillus karajensis]CDQ24949.1 hypothetical protein BN983_03250 [Halobacillus karajensis]CDQ28690.1 hypothetical protein BN981_03003 [Halobacillus karajensis]